MLLNKYINLALNLAILVVAYLGTVSWTDFLSAEHAGIVVMVLAAVKAVLNVFQPGPGEKITATGNALITHK